MFNFLVVNRSILVASSLLSITLPIIMILIGFGIHDFFNEEAAAVLQLFGGILMMPGYLFQIYSSICTKTMSNTSLPFIVLIFLGITLMQYNAIYLYLLNNTQYSFLITNSISLLLSYMLIICKYYYDIL